MKELILYPPGLGKTTEINKIKKYAPKNTLFIDDCFLSLEKIKEKFLKKENCVIATHIYCYDREHIKIDKMLKEIRDLSIKIVYKNMFNEYIYLSKKANEDFKTQSIRKITC